MNEKVTSYEKFLQRYEEDRVPWDSQSPPPEIIELAGQLSPGQALDLGCGYGRTAIYLAQHGWRVVGIDFVPQAIERAIQRATVAGVESATEFYTASATDLSFLTGPFDLIIDIGCMHSFSDEMLSAYRDELGRLLAAGGLYVLFAHLRSEDDPVEDDTPKWIDEAWIYRQLSDYFELEKVEIGTTQVEDKPPWKSGWFWFRRR